MAKRDFSISIDDKELNKQLKAAIQRNPKAAVKAVKDCALDLAANSAKRAPVDTGDLRNNCNADLSKVNGLKSQATIGYSLPYALRQHEELEYNHPKGGEAKFLERPFEERKQRYIDRISRIPEEVIK